jgi:hypothetical protein
MLRATQHIVQRRSASVPRGIECARRAAGRPRTASHGITWYVPAGTRASRRTAHGRTLMHPTRGPGQPQQQAVGLSRAQFAHERAAVQPPCRQWKRCKRCNGANKAGWGFAFVRFAYRSACSFACSSCMARDSTATSWCVQYSPAKCLPQPHRRACTCVRARVRANVRARVLSCVCRTFPSPSRSQTWALQHSTAQHSTAQHSTAQHSTATTRPMARRVGPHSASLPSTQRTRAPSSVYRVRCIRSSRRFFGNKPRTLRTHWPHRHARTVKG